MKPVVSADKRNLNKTIEYLKKMEDPIKTSMLEEYGEKGLQALREATPKQTGKTAESWSYSVSKKHGSTSLEWYNSNEKDGVNIAVVLQYGHGTGIGGYVKGIDYINPALKPIFHEILSNILERGHS